MEAPRERDSAHSDTLIADRTSAFLQNVPTSARSESPERVAGVRLLLDEASRRMQGEVRVQRDQ